MRAIAASCAFAKYEPWVVACAFLLGGGAALAAHTGKITTRTVVTMSPEPVSNAVTSLAEDAVAPVVLASALWIPLLALVFVAIGCVFAIMITRMLLKRRKKNPSTTVPS